MFGRSSTLASHCKYMINLVDQLVSKNVISFVDIHEYMSMSMSVSVNIAGNKNVKQVNKIDFNIFCDRVSF